MIRNQYGAGAFRSTCGREVYEVSPACKYHAGPAAEPEDEGLGGALFQGALF